MIQEKVQKIQIATPVRYVSAGTAVLSKGWRHENRNIDTSVVIFGIEGCYPMFQEETHFTIVPNSVSLLSADHNHGGDGETTGNLRYNWFHFYAQSQTITLEKAIQELQSLDGVRNDYVYLPVHFVPKDTIGINILFKQLIYMREKQYYTHRSADYLATSILIEISEQFRNSFMRDQAYKSKSLQAMLEYIRLNLVSDLTVTTIAENFHYSREHISRIFKENLGVTVHHYINLMRVEMAKKLLMENNDSIEQIAYLCGYNDSKYFSQMFKKVTDLTPTQYKNAYNLTHYVK